MSPKFFRKKFRTGGLELRPERTDKRKDGETDGWTERRKITRAIAYFSK